MKLFKINSKANISKEKKYPNQTPFVVQGNSTAKFLVVFDKLSQKYRFVSLDDGVMLTSEFDTLQEMFNDNKDDKVLVTELNVVGEWNGEE